MLTMTPREHDGTPQPATQPLTYEEATALEARTGGQLRPYLHADGSWRCYDARTAHRPLGIRPRWSADNEQARQR
jgi:hypothetical protein